MWTAGMGGGEIWGGPTASRTAVSGTIPWTHSAACVLGKALDLRISKQPLPNMASGCGAGVGRQMPDE